MKWSHWNYPTHCRIPVDFDNYEEAKRLIASPEKQIIICHATTKEDYLYVGEGWQCEHLLHPEECLHCNPEYRNAFWDKCPNCYTDSTRADTWHIPVAGGLQCLRCKVTRPTSQASVVNGLSCYSTKE